MAEKFVIPIHGQDHCPGGPDPIPCLGMTALRATYQPAGGLTVGNDSETIIIYDDWENEDSAVFGETLFGGDLQKVSLLQQGVYTVTIVPHFSPDFDAMRGVLVLDDSATTGNRTLGEVGNMGQYAPRDVAEQFVYPLTFSVTRKWPLKTATGTAPWGRLVTKVIQKSGSNKTLDAVEMDILYHGPTKTSV